MIRGKSGWLLWSTAVGGLPSCGQLLCVGECLIGRIYQDKEAGLSTEIVFNMCSGFQILSDIVYISPESLSLKPKLTLIGISAETICCILINVKFTLPVQNNAYQLLSL